MSIFDLLRPKPKSTRLVTSRPVFQHSSSFLNSEDDDDDFQKPPPLPLYHQRTKSTDNHDHDNSGLPRASPRPRSQSRLHLILHILNLIFTVTSLALYTTTIPIWNANFQHTKSLVSGDYTDALVLAPLLLSLATSTYLLLTEHTPLRFHLRPRLNPRASSPNLTSSRPTTATTIQPIKSTTLALLSLTILLTLAPTLTLSATNSLALAWRTAKPTRAGLVVCNLTNIFSRECQPILYQIGALQIAGTVMGALAWGVWAVVVVIAVRGWSRERNERKKMARERRRQRRRERRRERGDGHERSHRSRSGRGHKSRSRSEKSEKDIYGVEVADVRKPPVARAGSQAVQQTTRTVRPKETIQAWLNERYTPR